jgi:uncharacterized membrane protein YkvA (DUF1232 family)
MKPSMKLKHWARGVKRDVLAIYLASRDPRVPWYAKALAVCVASYAMSPIDLIPDFVPVLGYLDDLIIVPLGILLVVRLIPAEIMQEHRAAATARQEARPVSRVGAAIIAVVWICMAGLLLWWFEGAEYRRRLSAARTATPNIRWRNALTGPRTRRVRPPNSSLRRPLARSAAVRLFPA